MTAEGAFHYRDGELYCEQVPARAVAEQFGTPCYLYSAGELCERFRRIRDAFAEWSPVVCFSVKSCGNLSVLKLLAGEGSGFDVVSGGSCTAPWPPGRTRRRSSTPAWARRRPRSSMPCARAS